jgi:hypothetical protein
MASALFLTQASAAATVKSVASGAWSDPATWDVGVPADGDDVTIDRQHVVLFDIAEARPSRFTLDRNGELTTFDGLAGTSGGDGDDAAGIRIVATGDINLFGIVRTGRGGDGDALLDNPAPGVAALAQGGRGGKGGDISLVSTTGSIRVNVTSRVLVGTGGDGGDATALASASAAGDDGASAEAHAGKGGQGGTLSLSCGNGNLLLAAVTDLVTLGNGGRGGDSSAMGGPGGDALPLDLPGAGGGATSFGGDGGRSGSLILTAATLNGIAPSASAARTMLRAVLVGGLGGDPGVDTAEAGAAGALDSGAPAGCFDARGKDAAPVVVGPTHGGAGVLAPTPGADATAVALAGILAGQGGSAFATGGNGGAVLLVTAQLGAGATGLTLAASIARGGDAFAIGGGGSGSGGRGGDGEARGGNAGSHPIEGVADLSARGGNATATGGTGIDGVSCCEDLSAGQDGGNGGDARAYGGNANNRATGAPSQGGSVTTRPGSGGDAGSGVPPGDRGLRGDRDRVAGSGSPAGAVVDLNASHGRQAERCARLFLRVVGPATSTIDGEWITSSGSLSFTGPNNLPLFEQAFVPVPADEVLAARVRLTYPDGTMSEVTCAAFDENDGSARPLAEVVLEQGGYGPTIGIPDVDGVSTYSACDLVQRQGDVTAYLGERDLDTAREIENGSNPFFIGAVFGAMPVSIDLDNGTFVNPAPLSGTVVTRAYLQLVEECGIGTVNAGAGERRPSGAAAHPLTINGSPTVARIRTGVPLKIDLGAAPAGPASQVKYLLWVWAGRPQTRYQVSSGASQIGCSVGATPFHRPLGPQPILCLRGSGIPQATCIGIGEVNAPRYAPFVIGKDNGLASRTLLTFQGIMKDSAAANPTGYSMTNAVILDVEPMSFDLLAAYPTGDRPSDIATGDLDEDGLADAVVVSTIGAEITILRGNGNGTFTPTGTLFAGNRLLSVVLADLDGDTHLDAAVTSEGTDEVLVFAGDGMGGLALAGSSPVGSDPSGLLAIDVDGDLDLDLVTVDRSSDTVSVLLGDGALGFSPGGSFSTGAPGSAPLALAAADLDGDLDLDLAVANSLADAVAILSNDGSGLFAVTSTLLVGNGPSDVVLADLDGDGRADVATGNTDGDDVTVVLRTGDDASAFGTPKTYAGGSSPTRLLAADIDLDATLDLLVSETGSDKIAILFGDGTGTFGAPQRITVASGPRGVVATDLDGDGDSDLVVCNSLTNNVTPVRNRVR